MKNQKLTIIRGGLSDSPNDNQKIFLSAYVTDTRLMGVIGMYIHWSVPENPVLKDFHQFFYFDSDEFGFETYIGIMGNDANTIKNTEHTMIDVLGGKKIDISEKEAIYILNQYVKLNKKKNLELPEGHREYEFLLKSDVFLSKSELHVLMSKQCTNIDTPYTAINYFLMRSFGKDFDAASFLAKDGVPIDLFPEMESADLCKNSIDKSDKIQDEYICESVIEYDEYYTLVITNITLEENIISTFEKISSFKISAAEATMMLSRPEFISVFDLMCSPEDFTQNSTILAQHSMLTVHDYGKLFLIFNLNNDHISKQTYRLNEDVFGLYFITDIGQLIAASYNLHDIHTLEKDLSKSEFNKFLVPVSKYEFKDPVLYEFVQSNFDDFEEFIEAIKDDD